MSNDLRQTAWTVWLVRLQLLLVAVLLLGVVSVRFSLLPFRTGFSGFGLALVSMAGIAALALIALIIGWFKGAKAWQPPALRALIIGALPIVAILLLVGPAGFKVPPIHDITTDLQDPPEFVAAKAERTAQENSLDYGGPELAQIQAKAYPNIQPLRLDSSTDQAFVRAQAVVQDFGWRVIRSDSAAGIIEAVEESAVFGFKDDLIIRVLPTEEGSQIDVRSVSRVGVSDLGANAKRIRRVLTAMKES